MEVLVGHKENLIRISEVVHQVIDDFRRQLPQGVEATVWGDSTDYIDDAVVVGESIFEQRKTDSDPITGTEAGVAKVPVATVFGVLTTVAAFFPMLLLDNPLAKAWRRIQGLARRSSLRDLTWRQSVR